jgi:hypothetical protein
VKEGPTLDPKIPAKWTQRQKFDETGQVWDFIQRLSTASQIKAYDVELTAESSDGLQHIEFSGAVEGGYDASQSQKLCGSVAGTAGAGSLRMTIGSLGFATGQALLDWLKAANQQFDMSKVRQ